MKSTNDPQSAVKVLENKEIEQSKSYLWGRYQLKKLLGKGGAGSVYRAYDNLLKRDIAIKFINTDQSGSETGIQKLTMAEEAFIKEARVLAQLNHPNIIPIYDLNVPLQKSTDDLLKADATQPLSFTMEEIQGSTLDQFILKFHRCSRHESFTLFREILNIMIAVSKAVGWAHHKGVIHRDLKPNNIIVGRFGDVKVIDWGLGKVSEDKKTVYEEKEGADSQEALDMNSLDQFDLGLTFTGRLSGTPLYMSPEQARLEELDARTDVYSLGSVLYAILTGFPQHILPNRPIPTTQILLDMLSRNMEPTPIKKHRVPHPYLCTVDIISVCDKAMSMNREDRYEDANAFAQALESILGDDDKRRAAQRHKDQSHKCFKQWLSLSRNYEEYDDLWERSKDVYLLEDLAALNIEINRELDLVLLKDPSDSEALLMQSAFFAYQQYAQWRHSPLRVLTTNQKQPITETFERLADVNFLVEKEYGQLISNTLSSLIEAYTQDQTVFLNLASKSNGSFLDFKVEIFNRYHWDKSQNELASTAINEGTLPNLSNQSPELLPIDEIQAQSIKLKLPYGVYTLKLSLINAQTEPILVQFEVPFSDLFVRLSQHLKGLPTFDKLSKLFTHSPEWCDILRSKPLRLAINLPDHLQLKYLNVASWVSSPQKARLGSRVMVTNAQLNYKKYIEPFWIGREQVTNREYADFLLSLMLAMPIEQHALILDYLMPRVNLQMEQLRGQPAYIWVPDRSNWKMNPIWTSMGADFDTPLNWVSASQLSLYMLWLSWRDQRPVCFPTTEQWEFSCRGIDGRLFPWGDKTYKGFAQNTNISKDSDVAKMFKNALQKSLPNSEYKHPFSSPVATGITHLKRAQLFPRDQSPFNVTSLAGGLSDLTISSGRLHDHIVKVNTSASEFGGSIHTLLESSLWQKKWQSITQSELNSIDEALMAVRGGSHINTDSKSNAVYIFKAIYYRCYADIGARLVYL